MSIYFIGVNCGHNASISIVDSDCNLIFSTDIDRHTKISYDFGYFENSYFSIVTETTYNQYSKAGTYVQVEKEIFPSEKIYKPIMMMHPFILMGRPNFLATLRSHGYKTFHPYIDETYDTVEDDNERMQLIFNEIKKLVSFTDEQYKEWMQNIKPIVEHNKAHFFSKTHDYRVTKDVLKYFE